MNIEQKNKIKIFFRKILIKIAKFLRRGYGLSRLAFLRKTFNFVYSLAQGPGFIIPVGEFKMVLDEKDTLGLSLGRIHEPHITQIAKKELQKGNTVIDLGANIGYFTLIFSRLVGLEGKVFAFEPDPVNFSILEENIRINKCSNVVLIKKAIADKNQKGFLYLNEENKGDHRIYDSGDKREKIETEITSLNDHFSDFDKKINFIKMDIQGSEILALRGMKNILEVNKKIKILAEFWPFGLKKQNTEPIEFFEILKKYNFCFFQNNENNPELKPIQNISLFLKNLSFKEDEAATIFATACQND